MGGTTSQILVSFAGEGSGVGEMTWGQREIWKTIARTGRTLNIGGTMPLAAGTPVEEFTGLLSFVMSRHQALRTRLDLVDGTWPRQVVSSRGEAPFDIVDVDPGDDTDAAAEELRSRYEFTPFDYAHEWPVRMGVVRQGGELTHFVVQYCHLAVDGFGIEAIIRDLAQRGRDDSPVKGVQPLEIAARQQSPAGRRQSGKSLRHWENILRRVPARRFGDSTDQREPRFWELVCHSPALRLALRRVADRTGAETGHVLLAAVAVALAGVTGQHPTVVQVLVSNRFRPGFAESVAQLTQPGICSVDVADSLFDEVVARARKAATTAYMTGWYDTGEHAEMLARVAADRGEEVDTACFVNDRRGPVEPGAVPGEDDLRAAVPLTTIRWDRTLDTYDGTFYLQVDAVPDAVDFAIWADTRHLSPAEIEACARTIESVAVQAALDPLATTGIRTQAAV